MIIENQNVLREKLLEKEKSQNLSARNQILEYFMIGSTRKKCNLGEILEMGPGKFRWFPCHRRETFGQSVTAQFYPPNFISVQSPPIRPQVSFGGDWIACGNLKRDISGGVLLGISGKWRRWSKTSHSTSTLQLSLHKLKCFQISTSNLRAMQTQRRSAWAATGGSGMDVLHGALRSGAGGRQAPAKT